MLQKSFYTSCFLLLLINSAAGQQKWDLEKCIQYAWENNLTLTQNQISIQQENLRLGQSKRDRYPNANASGSYGINFGRSIDPTTNAFIGQSFHNNGFSLSFGVPVYQGQTIKNTIEQNKLNLAAAKEDFEQSKRDIALSVAQAYLQILLNIEQVNNANTTRSQTQEQLDQTNKLINAGSKPAGDRLDIEAQLARDEQAIISAQNNLEISYLNLKFLLRLDPTTSFEIEQPKIPIPPPESLEILPMTQIYQKAIQDQPNIRAGKLRKQSSEYNIELAKAGLRPNVSLSGSISTNYSSFARRATGDIITLPPSPIGQTSPLPTGETLTVFSESQEIPVFEDQPYFSQLEQNLSTGFSVFFSVPLYDKGATKNNIALAELGIKSVELQNEQLKQSLKTDIQQAIANAKAAGKQLQAAQRTLDASQLAYNNMEKRFNLGVSNNLEFTTAKNNLDSAKFSLVIAKYDYIFKLKILDFYQGKKITIK